MSQNDEWTLQFIVRPAYKELRDIAVQCAPHLQVAMRCLAARDATIKSMRETICNLRKKRLAREKGAKP